MFFADDSILFIKADKEQFCCIRDVLARYSDSIGQVINFSKSEACFGQNV